MQRFVGAVQQQSSPITEARIISEALPPRDKSWPKSSVVLLGALFGGLFLGMGTAFAREKLDTVVRTSVQGEKLLGVECLGILPALNIATYPSRVTPGWFRSIADPCFAAADPDSGYVLTAPFPQFTETLRSVKISMARNKGPDGCQVVGINICAPRRRENHDRDEPRSADRADRQPRAADRCRLAHDVHDGSPDAECPTGLLEVLTRRATIAESVWQPYHHDAQLPAVGEPHLDRPHQRR